MLDGQPAVIAIDTKAIAELAPPLLAVSYSQRDVTPSAVPDMVMRNSLQAAGQIENTIVQICILRMHMMYRITKGIDCRQRIGAHPKQVTGIEIRADGRTHNLP